MTLISNTISQVDEAENSEKALKMKICPMNAFLKLLEKFRVKCQAEVTLFRVGRMHSAAARPLGRGAC